MELSSQNKECLKIITELKQNVLSETLNAFSNLETNGASKELKDYYFNYEPDPEWFQNLNLVQIKDWRVSAKLANYFNLATKIR